VTDTWTSVTDVHSPWVRAYHAAVAAGNLMLVWGGVSPLYLGGNWETYQRNGGRYVLVDTGDADGDGISACNGDCNDLNPAVHPGAAEVCDGLDDDCDGQGDVELPDLDGDGYSACRGDCNDANR